MDCCCEQSVWEAADEPAHAGFSLDELFEHARAYTLPNGNPTGTGSHVTRWGDVGMGSQLFAEFIGSLPSDVGSAALPSVGTRAAQPPMQKNATGGAEALAAERQLTAALGARLQGLRKATGGDVAAIEGVFDCYRRLNAVAEARCPRFVPDHDRPDDRRWRRLLLRGCGAGAEVAAADAIREACAEQS